MVPLTLPRCCRISRMSTDSPFAGRKMLELLVNQVKEQEVAFESWESESRIFSMA